MYLPERTEEGRVKLEVWVESPQSSVVHVGVSKLDEPRSCCPGALALVHLQEALTDLGVKAVWLGRSRMASATYMLTPRHSTSKLGRERKFLNLNIENV